jgi:hypothetical protein
VNSSIETLVQAHLHAYCEPDAARRMQAIRSIWNPEGRLVDPPLESARHAGIGDQAATLLSQFPGHTFHLATAVDQHHDFARYGWVLRSPAGTDVLAGTDFMQLDVDGRILCVVGFFGEPAPRK